MANAKQDASNITSCEFYTGRCPSFCEQCFVNFGQQGMALVHNITSPGSKKWFDYACKNGTKQPHPWRPAEMTPEAQAAGRLAGYSNASAICIPVTEKPKWFRRQPTITITGVPFPLFLRVSSMSDSSYSPAEWCRRIRDAWGDYCFFNSSIRSLAWQPQNLMAGVYHKLVCTVNPGFQKVPSVRPPPKPREKKPKPPPQWRRTASGRQVFRNDGDDDDEPVVKERAFDRTTTIGKAWEKMGKVRHPGDFLDPVTLLTIGRRFDKQLRGKDLSEWERVIKFYRLRALPTIEPAVPTDKPLVITQMRFKGTAFAVEFARKYGLGCEVATASKKMRDDINTTCKGYPIKAVDAKRGTTVRLWTIPGTRAHEQNVSPNKKHATEMSIRSAFLRVEPGLFDHQPWVCDRAHGSCKMCGLCATLDATQPGMVNALNVVQGQLIRPVEGSYSYTNELLQLPDAGDYFADIFYRAAGIDADEVPYYISNPSEPLEVVSEAKVAELLNKAALYTNQGDPSEDEVCEGWNTHEDSETLVAYCVWCLVCHAKAHGLGREEGMAAIQGFIYEATSGIDVTSGVDGLYEIWDDESQWTEEFGPTSP